MMQACKVYILSIGIVFFASAHLHAQYITTIAGNGNNAMDYSTNPLGIVNLSVQILS